MKQQSNKSAAIYCRVATRAVSDKERSIKGQEEICRARAVQDGMEVVAVIHDAFASGATLKREGLQELLRLVRARKIGAVYVADLNRLSRRIDQIIVLKRIFQRYGVALVSDASTATSKFADGMTACFGAYYSALISEKTKQGILRKKMLTDKK